MGAIEEILEKHGPSRSSRIVQALTRYLIAMRANTPELPEDEDIDYSDIPELSDDAVLVWSGPIRGYLEFLRTARETTLVVSPCWETNLRLEHERVPAHLNRRMPRFDILCSVASF